MSSPKIIIIDEKKTKSIPINISKSVPNDDLGKSPPKVQTSLYKTEKCRSWISTGMCKYGNKCQFAHGEDELRPVMRHPKYKTQICKTFSRDGFCPYGTRCRFIHPGEIESKSPSSSDYLDFEGNSAPNGSGILGRISFSPSPINSNIMQSQLFSDRNTSETPLPSQNSASSNQIPLFSSSLPNFSEANWLQDKKEFKQMAKTNNGNNNPGASLWNNSIISPTKNARNELNDDFYDPFNMNEGNNSFGKKNEIFSPKNSFFPSSPISQFSISPSPLSGGNPFFNLSNPSMAISSPPNNRSHNNSSNNLAFNLDDDYNNLSPRNGGGELELNKKRTSSIPLELSSPSTTENKSKPTSIPIKNNSNNTNGNSATNSPQDNKSRLPIFASLAN